MVVRQHNLDVFVQRCIWESSTSNNVDSRLVTAKRSLARTSWGFCYRRLHRQLLRQHLVRQSRGWRTLLLSGKEFSRIHQQISPSQRPRSSRHSKYGKRDSPFRSISLSPLSILWSSYPGYPLDQRYDTFSFLFHCLNL